MAVKGLSEEGDTTLSLEKHSSESPKNFGVCVHICYADWWLSEWHITSHPGWVWEKEEDARTGPRCDVHIFRLTGPHICPLFSRLLCLFNSITWFTWIGCFVFSTFLRRPSVCHEMEILYGCNVYEVTGRSINLGVGGGHWDKWQMRSSLKAQRESLEGQEVTVAGYWKREAPPAGSHTIKLLFILSVGEGWLVISLLETNQNTRSELWSSH